MYTWKRDQNERRTKCDRTVNVQLDGFDEHGQIKHEVKHTHKTDK